MAQHFSLTLDLLRSDLVRPCMLAQRSNCAIASKQASNARLAPFCCLCYFGLKLLCSFMPVDLTLA
eukprot:7803523-Heterocapsa_arctica.AAC.1